MSEEKKAPEKKAQPGKGAKVLNWFKMLPQRIAKPFRNMYYELKKVTWPSKQRLISFSIIVLVFMLFMSVVIGLLDLGASAAVRRMIYATSSSSSTGLTPATDAEEAEVTAEPAAEEAEATAEPAAEEAAATAEPTAEATAEPAAEETTSEGK